MTIDPTFSTAALAGLEASINKALDYDPGSRIALAKLQGKLLQVELSAPSLSFFIAFDSDAVRILSCAPRTADTRVRGSAIAMALLLGGNSHNLADSGVEVLGSTALLGELQAVLKNLDIDWEEALSQLLGDVLGHQSAELIRSKFDWLHARGQSGSRLFAEFVSEELNSVPAKTELQDFYRQVDQLRLDADRLQARIQQFADKLVKDTP